MNSFITGQMNIMTKPSRVAKVNIEQRQQARMATHEAREKFVTYKPVMKATRAAQKDSSSKTIARSRSTTRSLLPPMIHRRRKRRKRTIIEEHNARISETKKTINAACLIRRGVPLGFSPPGTVNAAVNVIVAKSAAITPIVLM